MTWKVFSNDRKLVSFSVILFTQIYSLSSSAQLKSEHIKFDTRISNQSILNQKINEKDPLVVLKKKAESKQWADCAKTAQTQFAKNKDLQPWILLNWLKCARKNIEVDKKAVSSLNMALGVLDKNPNFLLLMPWKMSLQQESVAARMIICDAMSAKPDSSVWLHLEKLMENFDLLDKDQKAKVYQWTGEVSFQQRNLKGAQQYLQLSLNEKESKVVKEKLQVVQTALGISNITVASPAVAGSVGANGNGGLENIPDSEKALVQRMQEALKQNEWISFVDDGIEYLRVFPNGKKSKWVSEKVLDVYLNLFDSLNQAKDPQKVVLIRERVLNGLDKSDAVRLSEWAKILHRRGDFLGSLQLSQTALKELNRTTMASNLLYISGRSASFLGDYRKALKFFNQYQEQHSGGEDYIEVLFRSGLSHLRLQEFPAAISYFEKILSLKNIDKYELSSKYWLARSFQQTGNPRAQDEIEKITAKYPLSYFGIRLKAEGAKGVFEWPTPLKLKKELSGDIYFSPAQKQAWARIQRLTELGWFSEAGLEISNLPIPKDAELKVLLAQKFAQAQSFPLVIKMLNNSTDAQEDLKVLEVLNLGFPLVFKNKIQEESQKYALSPYLVQSLIRQESAFGLTAQSTSNAMGLMQLIPPTAQEVANELKMGKISIPEDVYDPMVNIQMGTYYINKMIRQFGGSVPLGLAAYNAGPTRVQLFVQARPEMMKMTEKMSSEVWDELWFDEIPWMETSFYVKAILRNVLIYKAMEQGRVNMQGVIWKDLAESPSQSLIPGQKRREIKRVTASTVDPTSAIR